MKQMKKEEKEKEKHEYPKILGYLRNETDLYLTYDNIIFIEEN